MKNTQIRHGENLFISVPEIPKGARLVEQGNNLVVAHSETGHNHTLTLPKTSEAFIKIFELDGVTYLDVPLEAKLQHQKTVEAHPTLTMKKGFYRKLVDQEFDYGAKLLRRVMD